MAYNFSFGRYKSSVHIEQDFPRLDAILEVMEAENALIVCDTNTFFFAERIMETRNAAVCGIPAGEEAKGWPAVEKILKAAHDAGLGRDGLFVAVGGGVVSDLCGFAASIYKRGAQLAIVSTTLLGMADAALGGKTGFDMLGIKNFTGSFYPARHIYMPIDAILTLPEREWRSGLAEIVKSAILDGSIHSKLTLDRFLLLTQKPSTRMADEAIGTLLGKTVGLKGRIVEKDPLEQGERVLLNLGHTFGHALESAAGLGRLSHGEAVAWGIARACELGLELGITTQDLVEKIRFLLSELGYETKTPHPAVVNDVNGKDFMLTLEGDKKKKSGTLRFVVPSQTGAEIVPITKDRIPLIKRIAGLS
jgi:3-dehydroquinate synthase